MISDGDALLAAILAFPAEDTPRLVYADYLDEQDAHSRAELIRVQCELDRRWALAIPRHVMTYAMFPPGMRHEWDEFDKLRTRERELLPSFADALRHRYSVRMEFQSVRGFVESLTCTAQDWLAHAASITRAHPVERVTLTTLPTGAQLQARRTFVNVGEWLKFTRKFSGPDPEAAFLKDEWPGIEFTLPTLEQQLAGMPSGEAITLPPGYTETITASSLPVDGWRCEHRARHRAHHDYETPTTFYEVTDRSLDLALELVEPIGVPEGTELPLVRSTDTFGRRWECRAILYGVTHIMEQANFVTRYEARSMGPVTRIASG
jgi:uncharacterized protein (TIGR02996 family)